MEMPPRVRSYCRASMFARLLLPGSARLQCVTRSTPKRREAIS
jgi:hypothetical protein